MKKYMLLLVPAFFLLISSTVYAQRDPRSVITYQDFYDDLSAYGTWINYPSYGFVWSPNIAGEFAPYATNGYWLYSERGWFWKSNYPWGWAVFHYGRWLYDDYYGWLWVPGYDWSPAWVEWGSFDDYYAWAPLTPEVDVNINHSSWKPHNYFWNVVPRKYILEESMSKRILPKERMRDVVHKVSVMGNMKYNSENRHYSSGGPEIKDAKQNMKRERDVPTTRIIDNRAPENTKREKIDKKHEEVQVYKPRVENEPKQPNAGNNSPTPPGNNNANADRNNTVPQNKPAQSRTVESQQTKPVTPNTSQWPTTNNKTQRSNVKELSGAGSPPNQRPSTPRKKN